MKLYKKIYKSIPEEKITLIARVRKDIRGRYHFETNTNHGNFEINMNMPMFRSEEEAYRWIKTREDWKPIAPNDLPDFNSPEAFFCEPD